MFEAIHKKAKQYYAASYGASKNNSSPPDPSPNFPPPPEGLLVPAIKFLFIGLRSGSQEKEGG
jgi:hypothetical protein